MRTSMKISQSAWDSLWENSAGTQMKMTFESKYADYADFVTFSSIMDETIIELSKEFHYKLANTLGQMIVHDYTSNTSCWHRLTTLLPSHPETPTVILPRKILYPYTPLFPIRYLNLRF